MKGPRSLGITGRLLLSFMAVAVLAAAANLIAEHGVAIIQNIGSTAGSAAAPPATRHSGIRTVTTAAPLIRQLPAVDSQMLVAAIERYQRAVEVRASLDSPAASLEVESAAENLDAVYTAIRAAAGSPDLPPTSAAPSPEAFETAGSKRIQLADARRLAVEQYVACADGMERRLTVSMNRAMKIFGRVLARQSLMQQHTELDDIRRRFARIANGDTQPAAIQALASGEAGFAATLDSNVAAFTRSQGGSWVRQMQADLARTIELRKSIAVLDVRARDSSVNLEASRLRLSSSIPTAHSASMSVSTPPPQTHVQDEHEVLLPAQAQPAPPISRMVTTSTTPADDHARRTVAWITAAVLIVLLTVSLMTIRSIQLPVRRMLDATEKIAAGDVDVRVAGGGIEELETLGSGFNRMAVQLAAARDMTRDYQQRLEEKVEQRTRQLQHLAEHDPLTHLPNRRQLFVLLNHALERAAQHQRHVAVFFMDIDNFKNLNDSMGHAFGDLVLAGIAQRLKDAAQIFGFAGRLGGDEFTVVYEDAASEAEVAAAGRRLVGIFDQPLVIDGREVIVRASVGASMYPVHGDRAEDLLSAADAALFQAKALGRGQLTVFTPELLAIATRRFTIEQGLRRAIAQNEFELVFQPEVSLESLDVVLVESLVRWRLPDGRQAPPGEFLPYTEESGLIVEIGNWVLRKAIETAAGWHHGDWPESRVAINVSPRQLVDSRFVDSVLELLAEFNLPTRCIELELTESVLQTGPTTIESLRRLRAHEIAIALDDFGTGYSSLASLETLPLTRIKLDRSLIASIDTNARSAAIATALIGLCNGLGIDITAEGVERPEQFAVLAEHRALHLQGYLICRPIAPGAVLEMRRMIPQIMQDLLLTLPAAGPAAGARALPRLASVASPAPVASGRTAG